MNADERKLFDIAKQKVSRHAELPACLKGSCTSDTTQHSPVQGFLTLKGSGYRAERKGSPIANSFRQHCDAVARPCIVVEQGTGSNPADIVLLDLSPLRSKDLAEVQAASESAMSAACHMLTTYTISAGRGAVCAHSSWHWG